MDIAPLKIGGWNVRPYKKSVEKVCEDAASFLFIFSKCLLTFSFYHDINMLYKIRVHRCMNSPSESISSRHGWSAFKFWLHLLMSCLKKPRRNVTMWFYVPVWYFKSFSFCTVYHQIDFFWKNRPTAFETEIFSLKFWNMYQRRPFKNLGWPVVLWWA